MLVKLDAERARGRQMSSQRWSRWLIKEGTTTPATLALV
jgi:hypothetical protein